MEEKNKIKQKQMVLMFIGIAILVVFITGITFAFFNYTKTGGANVIKTGNIEFSMTQGKTINLQNVFPITSAEALADNSNTSVCEIVITGRNTYADGVEYLVSTVNATNTDVPVSILVSVENNGNGANDNLGTSDNDYFTNRNSYTTSHYKKLVDDSFTGNEQILVGYIASSASNDNSINGKITIRAYFDKNNIIITDTPDETNTGDKTVMSTSEWNALNSSGVSFQVRVEAREGKWVEEPKVTITYNANGGSVNPLSKQILLDATTYGNLPTPSRTDYKFDGWYTQASGGTVVVSSTQFINGTSPTTIYAHWKLIVTEGCYTGTLDEQTNEVTITDYNVTCGGTNAVIPSTIQDFSVTVIGENAFNSNKLTGVYGETIANVVIPSSIKKIEFTAFAYNRVLTSVNIPEGVEEIGEGAFYDCSNLSIVSLPNTLIKIKPGAFWGCAISDINFISGLNSLQEIGADAFSANRLSSVVIPASVTSMPCIAFRNQFPDYYGHGSTPQYLYANQNFTCSS